MFVESNVTVMVSDLDRAVAFYTEVLGLTLKGRYGDHWAEVEAPGLRIGLHPTSQPPSPDAAGGLSIGLGVADLQEGMATLKARGVQFAPPREDEGEIRLAFFRDPDGNPLYLTEVREEARRPTSP